MLSLMQAQIGASLAHIVICGAAISRSSSVPARTEIISGRSSTTVQTCTPHFGQKRRRMVLPLSALHSHSLNEPSFVKEALSNKTFTVALPAPIFWQTRHQQVRVIFGFDAIVYCTLPHKHLPVIAIRSPVFGQLGPVKPHDCPLAGELDDIAPANISRGKLIQKSFGGRQKRIPAQKMPVFNKGLDT